MYFNESFFNQESLQILATNMDQLILLLLGLFIPMAYSSSWCVKFNQNILFFINEIIIKGIKDFFPIKYLFLNFYSLFDFSKVTHILKIIAWTQIRSTHHRSSISKLCHPINIWSHHPFIAIDMNFHKPSEYFFRIDLCQQHEIS